MCWIVRIVLSLGVGRKEMLWFDWLMILIGWAASEKKQKQMVMAMEEKRQRMQPAKGDKDMQKIWKVQRFDK